jgi:uncharacterized protein YycO
MNQLTLVQLNPKPCDILFVHTHLIPSAVVRWWTNSMFDHVELCLGDGTSIGSRPSGGVQIRDLSLVNNEKHNWSLLRYKGKLSKKQQNEIINFAKKQIGKKYDWWGVFGLALTKDISKNSEWFCSELINTTFAKNGAILVPRKSSSRTVPELLYQSLALNVIASNIFPK